MPLDPPEKEKVRIREAYSRGEASKEDLLERESASYHYTGTCTFYGTANSDQRMMEVMGLDAPGAAFVNPGTKLRQELTRVAVHRLAEIGCVGRNWPVPAGAPDTARIDTLAAAAAALRG